MSCRVVCTPRGNMFAAEVEVIYSIWCGQAPTKQVNRGDLVS